MNNQKLHWDEMHKQGKIDSDSGEPSEFAKEVISIINPASKILELGCGSGYDSAAFAKAGHIVIATDFSDTAISKNTNTFKHIPDLKFEVVDMNNPLDFSGDQFDVIYARLSLHYFTEIVTRRLIDDIHKLLKPGGILCFICKSTNDPLYGKGIEIEKDMFEFNGHIRHFFSENYVKNLLKDKFTIEKIESGNEKFYNKDSAFIKVITRAIKY